MISDFPDGQTIGPFELLAPLGEGAMGRVFRARYPAQDVEVAVKIIHEAKAMEQANINAFHQEIQAMAGLDHPGIAHIYDYGTTTADETADWAEVSAGVPWLAMELGVGFNLESSPPLGDWPTLRRILLEILDALAHAHARQIIHRDLKPANVLIAKGACGYKLLLADFGIAHIWNPRVTTETGDVSVASAGTPFYMAPEQLHGQWRDYGAWTDLYAFGCLAFELISGAPPYDGESVLQLAMQHISGPIPTLDPLFDVPIGLDSWIRRLLAKDRFARFGTAAEAAWMLNELEGNKSWPAPLGSSAFPKMEAHDLSFDGEVDPRGATLDFSATNILSSSELSAAIAPDRREKVEGVTEGHRVSFRPNSLQVPFPVKWMPPRSNDDRQLRGAGEALVGLREVPFVDRDDARREFWSKLRESHQRRRPQVLCVESPAGLGKSRLVEWMTRRTHELGVGPTIRVEASAVASADEPLIQIVEQMFRLEGMSRHRAYERLLDVLERIEAILPDDVEPHWDRTYHSAALAHLIRPLADGEEDERVPTVTFERLAQKYDLVARFLYAYSRRQTAIVWCDDAHFGQSLVGLVEWIRDNEMEAFPILFVLSYRASFLADRPIEQEMFARLAHDPEAPLIELGALDPADHRTLVRNTLSLAPNLVTEVAERTVGNPFFATQLLEHWVEEDALRATSDGTGYVVADDAFFPRTVEELASRRISRVVDQFDDREAARLCMEIAAALARPVDPATLARVAARLEATVPDRFADRLITSGIARRLSTGWTFDEGLFRDRVVVEAREQNRWRRVHLALAEDLHEQGTSGQEERLARHFLESGRARMALDPLARALDRKVIESSYLEALALCDTIESVCDSLGLSITNRARVHAILRRSETLRFAGRFSDSSAQLDRVMPHVDAFDGKLSAEAYRIKAGLALMAADIPASLEAYEKAGKGFRAVGDHRGFSQIRHGQGFVLVTTGDWDDAQRCLNEARDAAVKAESKRDLGWAFHALAELELRRRPSLGQQHASNALKLFTEVGTMSGVALGHRTLADCARLAGDLVSAREHYEAVIEISKQIRSIHQAFGHNGLALLEAEEGDFEQARQRVEPIAERIDDIPPLFKPIPYLSLLLIYAHLDERERYDVVFDAVKPLVNVGALAHPDLISLPEKAGDVFWAKGDSERAAKSYELAAGFAQNVAGPAAERIRQKASMITS